MRLYYHQQVEYILVDDGSDPKELEQMHDFISEKRLSVRLRSKPNGGKLSALSHGIKESKGLYFTDLDSDDYMSEQHINNILSGIEEVTRLNNEGQSIVGVCGLSETPESSTFGDSFPHPKMLESYIKMRLDYGVKGNKVEVILTEKLRRIALNHYSGERRQPTNTLWFGLNDQQILFLNRPFETYYPPGKDSISNHLRKVQIASPNGTRDYYKLIVLKRQFYSKITPYLGALVNYTRFSLHGAKPFTEKEISPGNQVFLILLSPLSFALYCWDILCLTRQRVFGHLKSD